MLTGPNSEENASLREVAMADSSEMSLWTVRNEGDAGIVELLIGRRSCAVTLAPFASQGDIRNDTLLCQHD